MPYDYNIPSELAFFERGFGLSEEHNPNEPIISYIYPYESDKELVVSFNPSYERHTSLTVKIIDNNGVIVSLFQDEINEVTFQSWGNEKVIRVYLIKSFKNFLIYYQPLPRIIIQDD